MIGGERIGPEIVLSLAIPDSVEEGSASILGREDMLNTWGVSTLWLIWPKPESKIRDLRFGKNQGRTSGASTALSIWVNGPFRPARVRLIRGKSGLFSGMHIVKKLYARVCLGVERFKVGQGEWGMMTFIEKRHWVFPPVSTACAYSKLDEYFGKLRKAEIEAL